METLDQDNIEFIIPPAEEMRLRADKNKDYYFKEELSHILQAITYASESGKTYCYRIDISQKLIKLLNEKGYNVDYDITINQPPYKITW